MDSNPFRPPTNEKLYTLREIARDNRIAVRRSHATLKCWVYDGAVNLSGDHVSLDVWKVANVNHTSLEAIDRFLTAQNSLTAKCQIVGGSMDGRERSISDHIDRITTANLQPDSIGADELYHHHRFIDKFGNIRHFLVWAGVDNSHEVIMQKLEAE